MKIHQKVTYKYYGKVTVCTIEAHGYLVDNCLDDMFNIKVTSRSICRDEDVYNKELGNHIAESKATRKLHIKLLKMLKNMYAEIAPYYTELFQAIQLETNRLEREELHIKELTK